MSLFFFVFFFQAEDGIRDGTVTGVQTCALPISWSRASRPRCTPAPYKEGRPARRRRGSAPRSGGSAGGWPRSRSEERRVGKECRSRGSRDNYKKKSNRRTGRRSE